MCTVLALWSAIFRRFFISIDLFLYTEFTYSNLTWLSSFSVASAWFHRWPLKLVKDWAKKVTYFAPKNNPAGTAPDGIGSGALKPTSSPAGNWVWPTNQISIGSTSLVPSLASIDDFAPVCLLLRHFTAVPLRAGRVAWEPEPAETIIGAQTKLFCFVSNRRRRLIQRMFWETRWRPTPAFKSPRDAMRSGWRNDAALVVSSGPVWTRLGTCRKNLHTHLRRNALYFASAASTEEIALVTGMPTFASVMMGGSMEFESKSHHRRLLTDFGFVETSVMTR